MSIHVPDEKAKAVIDALEREMMDKLATKADLKHLQDSTSRDVKALETVTKADIAHVKESLSKDIRNQTNAMTLRLLLTAAGLLPAIVAVQKLF